MRIHLASAALLVVSFCFSVHAKNPSLPRIKSVIVLNDSSADEIILNTTMVRKSPFYIHQRYIYTDNFEPYITPNSEPDDQPMPDEQTLFERLLSGYERLARPVRNSSDIVTIKLGMTLAQIFDMDERNQVLVSSVWLDQEWFDAFLNWNPDDYNGLSVLRLPCEKIWLPDIVLYNNAAEFSDEQMRSKAMVTSKGQVFWPVPTKLRSTCKIDVTYFPFDVQRCRLKFGSWTYDGYQVDLLTPDYNNEPHSAGFVSAAPLKRGSDVDLSNYIVNGEWQLLRVESVRKVRYYSCCSEPYPDVTFYIYIQRRVLYYIYNVMFPCILMSALTLLVFCLPPDSGEKVALGITVLLSFSVFMLSVAGKLPETSEFVPLMSIYLFIVMSMISMSVTVTVFVLSLHHSGPTIQPVPRWVKSVALHQLARVLCMDKQTKTPLLTFKWNFRRRSLAPATTSGVIGNNVSLWANSSLRSPFASPTAPACPPSPTLRAHRFAPPHSFRSNTSAAPARSAACCEHTWPASEQHCAATAALTPHGGAYRGPGRVRNAATRHQAAGCDAVSAEEISLLPKFPVLTPSVSSGTAAPSPARRSARWQSSLSPRYSPPTRRATPRPPPRQQPTTRRILDSLDSIVTRYENEKQQELIIREWKLVAQVADRLLLFFFVTAQVVSTMCILVVMPASYRFRFSNVPHSELHNES